tara:strand:- start:228 stop:686 length:459 start_codon:yes stop_codon:yes gene_type:complete
MPEPPMVLTDDELEVIQNAITTTEGKGSQIRTLLGEKGDSTIHGVTWEVEAAVEALEVFASRWTIEILATLYIAGERRFNELRRLLIGISSRTLSDKLTVLREAGLINRMVVDGPPVRVTYCLTEHGSRAGRLLSPLVAYMKIHHGSVTGAD